MFDQVFGHFIDTKSMETSSGSDDQINQIMSLLVQKSTDISHLCDLIYHYNKSLGLTYTSIRREIGDLDIAKRMVALQNFLKVIEELKSPHLFIHVDEID